MLEASIGDVVRKFEGTVCSFHNKATKKDEVAYVYNIRGEPKDLSCKTITSDGKEVTAFPEFHYRRPRCGYIPTIQGAIHLRRWMAGKNWQIGINANNIKMNRFYDGINDIWYLTLLSAQKNIFEPDYEIHAERNYNALSRLFLWNRDGGEIYGIQQDRVATINEDNVLSHVAGAYKQELSDIIKRRDLPWLMK